ncbi:hypothetical protein BU17DRAFT_46258, partial [Hysterangium stoloniferum]
IDITINEALKRDTPHWRLQNACVPCTYIVEDEQPLEFSMQLTVDGNESLKCCEWNHGQKDEQGHMIGSPSIECMDSRQINSDMYLCWQDVDIFKNEVKHRKISTSTSMVGLIFPLIDRETQFGLCLILWGHEMRRDCLPLLH